MAYRQITPSVTSVGALNPCLRVFDVIMKTEFGTSYNSYLVRGKDKTALIDTCHLSFEFGYLENIREVCPLEEIDYIVCNHNEPDHSGSVADLVKLLPNAEVLATQAGSIYLKNIANNPQLNVRAVKDGEILDLGGISLRFLMAPFLHWPDTMFTWIEEEKVLFSCDFLGAHYCEPMMIDTHIVYPEKYRKAFQHYYDCIMEPFKPYVLKGLDKIKGLPIDFVCNSHGPVLTKGGMLPYCIEKYTEWSSPSSTQIKKIPIFYTSAYGNTRLAAIAIAEGIREAFQKRGEEADVSIHSLISDEIDDAEVSAAFAAADGFCIGSPTINKAATPPIWTLVGASDAINCKGRPVGVFGSYGWSGEGIPQMCAFVKGFQYHVIGEGFKFRFVPNQEDLAAAHAYGVQFVEEGFPQK